MNKFIMDRELVKYVQGKGDNIRGALKFANVDQFNKLDNLLRYLLNKYPEAPGSSGNHQAWPGGYYDHIDDCLKWAIQLHSYINPPCKLSDVVYVLFLHDIEKPLKYCSDRDYFTGKYDHSIRESLMEDFKIKPNEEQMNALKYIHGEGVDYKKDKRIMNELAAFCHIIDTMSARIFHSK